MRDPTCTCGSACLLSGCSLTGGATALQAGRLGSKYREILKRDFSTLQMLRLVLGNF